MKMKLYKAQNSANSKKNPKRFTKVFASYFIKSRTQKLRRLQKTTNPVTMEDYILPVNKILVLQKVSHEEISTRECQEKAK